MIKTTSLLVLLVVCVLGFRWLDRQALSTIEAEQLLYNPPSVDWMAIEDNVKKHVEISWMPLPRFPNGRDGAYAQRKLEALFNVKMTPILLDEAGYRQKKPMLFSAGDIPDIVWNGNPSDVQKDIYHGCIRPIPLDLIQKFAPSYFDLISETAPMGWLYANVDGKNWGLPTVWIEGNRPIPGVWRKDWLDAVGIKKEPESLEEFEEAFRRFTFNDPDGNGRDDTYGLTNTSRAWYSMFSEFFGAYGVLPFDWMERDGEIVWGGLLPEAKEVLGRIRGWREEGILDPEWLTDGLGGKRRLKEKLMSGRVGYAYSLSIYQNFDETLVKSLVNVIAELDPEAEIVPASLPVGPKGLRGIRNWGSASNIYVAGPGVIEEPLKLVRALKMIEYQVGSGEDTYLEFAYGKQGLHWEYSVSDEPGSGSGYGIVRLEPYVNERTFQSEVLPIWGVPVKAYEVANQSPERLAFDRRYRDPAGCLLNALGRPEMVPSASRYLEDLRVWQMSVYTKIIEGDLPLDYFDNFTAEWLSRGGGIMTQEAQEVLARKRVLFERIDTMRNQEVKR